MPSAPPLVTLFVLAYRQEAYVRAAIEGAFAQSYQPLEIVLSDDASPDGTFRVMEEMAAAYDGPHRVILNRNDENLGLTRHIDRVMELSHGELVVQNAGDDVSAPDRVERFAAAWIASGCNAMLFFSPAWRIDDAGVVTGWSDGRGPTDGAITPFTMIKARLFVIGATAGWSRRVFDVFGPLGGDLAVEDWLISFRAAALGPVVRLEESLLFWRTGGISTKGSNGGHGHGHEALFGWQLRYAKWHAANYRGILRDLDRHPVPAAEEIRSLCNIRIDQAQHQVDLAAGSRMRRLAMLPGSLSRSLRRRDTGYVLWNLKYLFAGLYMRYLDWRKARHLQE